VESGRGSKLAFSFVIHDQIGLFEILLHLTFRPYNAYCIYIGSNAMSDIIETVNCLIECYKTRFVSHREELIHYCHLGEFVVLYRFLKKKLQFFAQIRSLLIAMVLNRSNGDSAI
jgi:hypothetical protein